MDLAVQNASQAIDTTGVGKQTQAGLELGMSLAQRQQQIEKSRQEMQFQQDQHEMSKMDWFHSQTKAALSENDPNLRKIYLDEMAEQFPKVFDGKRMNPALLEAAKKVPSVGDAFVAWSNIWDMTKNPDLSVSDQHKLALAKDTVSHLTDMPANEALKMLMQGKQIEAGFNKALVGARVATPQAAAAAGMSQEELQKTMQQSSPIALRTQTQQTLGAQQQVNRDPILNAYKLRLDGASRVNDLIKDAESGKVKTNRAFLGQLNAEIARLETGSQSPGLGASEKTELLSAQAAFEGLKERFTGKPDDAVPKDIIKQVKGTMDSMTDSYMSAVHGRYNEIAAGATDIQKPIIEAKRESDIKSYTGKFGHWNAGVESPAPAAAPAAPRMTAEEMADTDRIAEGRLAQARQAAQSGAPVGFTEQDVKDWYKSKTGKDLEK